jgi:hypothetical protein
MPSIIRGTDFEFDMGQLHAAQADAYWALQPHRFKVLRCGRRFGKTEFAKTWIIQALLQGFECAWLAPQHMIWSEVYIAEFVDWAGVAFFSHEKLLWDGQSLPYPRHCDGVLLIRRPKRARNMTPRQ